MVDQDSLVIKLIKKANHIPAKTINCLAVHLLCAFDKVPSPLTLIFPTLELTFSLTKYDPLPHLFDVVHPFQSKRNPHYAKRFD